MGPAEMFWAEELNFMPALCFREFKDQLNYAFSRNLPEQISIRG